jgi:hypothetical protein
MKQRKTRLKMKLTVKEWFYPMEGSLSVRSGRLEQIDSPRR